MSQMIEMKHSPPKNHHADKEMQGDEGQDGTQGAEGLTDGKQQGDSVSCNGGGDVPSGSTKDADGRQRRPQFEDVADPSAPSSHSRRRGGGGGGGGSRVTTATSTASSKREALASIDARSWITSAGGGRYAPPAYASTAPIGRARPDYYSPYPYSTSPSPPPSPELSEMASLEGLSATSPPDRASISPGLARRPREAAYPYANNKTAVGVEALGDEDELGSSEAVQWLRGRKLDRRSPRVREPMLRGYVPTPLYATAVKQQPHAKSYLATGAMAPPSSHSVLPYDPTLHLGKYLPPSFAMARPHAISMAALRFEQAPPTPATTRRLLVDGQLTFRAALHEVHKRGLSPIPFAPPKPPVSARL